MAERRRVDDAVARATAHLNLAAGEPQIVGSLPVEVEERKALLYLQVPRTADRNQYLERHLEHIRTAREECHRLATPRALCRAVPVHAITPEGIQLAGGHHFTGEQIARLLAGSERVIFAVATLGPAIDDEVERLLEDKMYIEWYTLNAVGAAMTNEWAYRVATALRKRAAADGWQTTPPLGPGFKYWHLDDQRIVFDILPTEEVGVELTEHCIMVPYKTKSMVIGMGKNLPRRIAREFDPNPDDPEDDWRR